MHKYLNYYAVYIFYETDHTETETGKRTDVSQLIQVCYDINDPKTRERELKSLIRAKGETDCNYLLVITWDLESVEEYKGNSIRFVPLWKWLHIF